MIYRFLSLLILFNMSFLFFPTVAAACSGGLHIEVLEGGVYTLDYAAIIEQQPELKNCSSSDFFLTNRDQEIPIRVIDNSTGNFGPGSRIEWVAAPLHGPASWFDQYSTVNAYVLSTAPGTHARIREDASPPSGAPNPLLRPVHLEQENLMIRLTQQQAKPGEEPDVWYWSKLTHVDPQPFSLNFDLPDFAPAGKSFTAALDFRGLSDVLARGKEKPDDHTVKISLNGKSLTSVAWNGRDEIRKDIELPVALLKAKNNVLSLGVPKRYASWDEKNPLIDVVMFNFMELNYPIAGKVDVSDAAFAVKNANPQTPFELEYSGPGPLGVYSSGGHYLAGRMIDKGRWRFAPASSADSLYISVNNRALAPTLVRAVAANDWRKADNGYDYLIISHPRLMEAVQPLAEFHRSRGLRVAVIDVNEVYDQFNAGVVHPRAIRNLIDHGYHNWTVKPRYVLLVGDASFDIRHKQINERSYAKWATQELLFPDQFGSISATPYPNMPKDLPNRNLIPTWQFPSPEGQSASDNWFVALKDKDFHPVLGIGRFPVVEPAEVSVIVKKTIDYLAKPQFGQWRRDVMFIANESDYFKQSSDQIAAQLTEQGFAAHKVYGSAQEKDNLAHKAEIKERLNQGQLLVHFIGHGGRFIWQTGAPDLRKNHELFTLDDVSALANGSHLPMVLAMTCYSAPFDNPIEDSIGERFLREADKGAIAVFAASWRNSPQPDYSKVLIAELLKPGMPIGEAIVTAKRKMQDRTLVETYNLLGDPALVLERPRETLTLAREDDRWQTRVVMKLPGNEFHGQINADWMDAQGQVVQADVYRVDSAQFHLPAPSAATAAKAVELHVYAMDTVRGVDAIGALALVAKKPEPATSVTAPNTAPAPAIQPHPKTESPPKKASAGGDRIARFDFEGGPSPMLVTELAKAKAPAL